MSIGRNNIPVKGILLSTVVVLILLLAIFSLSCTQQSPAPAPVPSPAPQPVPAPSPTPPSPPPAQPPSPPPSTGKWVADGIISAGEYTGTKSFGGYELRWVSDATNVYIAIRAKTSGWVALGIQPGSRMKDADMVFGFVKDAKATVYDLFSTGDFGPHPQDTELGGSNNITEFGGKEEGGFTIVEFKRALDTGDKYDRPLVKGINKIIWAYGSDDSLTLKHSNRGYGEIELP